MKKVIVFLLSISLILSLTACGSAGTAQTTPSGDTTESTTANSTEAASLENNHTAGEKSIVVGVTKDWSTINPLAGKNDVSMFVAKLAYDSLIDSQLDGTIHPRLATSWEYDENAKTVTFHLAENAFWSDGEPVTADDVVFTFQTYSSANTSTTTSYLAYIEGTNETGIETSDNSIQVAAADPYTVVVTLKQAVEINSFLYSLTKVNIVPSHILADVPEEDLATSTLLTENPVTAGPYKVSNLVEGTTIEFTANENYFQGAPHIDKITVNVYTSSTLAAAIASGECDYTGGTNLSEILSSDYAYLSSLENITIEPIYGYSFQYLAIDQSNELYADARVRKALSIAINRDEIVNNLLIGFGTPVYTPYNETHPYYDSTLTYPTYDPDLAVELLNEAGWDWDTEITIYTSSNNEIRIQAATMVQQYWLNIGVQTSLEVLDFATEFAGLQDASLSIGTMGQTGSALVADNTVLDGYLQGGTIDFSHLKSGEFYELLTKAKFSATKEEAQVCSSQFQKLVLEETPYIYLFSQAVLQANNNRLVNVDLAGGASYYWPVWEWDVTE